MEKLIQQALSLGASDIHLVCGLPPKFRVHGTLQSFDDTPLQSDSCDTYARTLAGDETFRVFEKIGEADFARTLAGARLRVNLFRQQGHVSAAIRILADEIPVLKNLGLPPAAEDLTKLPRGIVLVTGQTGSGKSTTLAAMLEEINQKRPVHILTLEDPIEYIYTPKMAVINQRQIGHDTETYALALRASLREDPDVILIGEMRDLETIETALTAAETGHLVFATLHTGSAADAVDRMVAVFPPERQQQIRMQLSMTLRAVLAQQLLPKTDGTGRVLAAELLVVNSAIRNLIREGKTPQIMSAQQTSAKDGSITMDNALIRLYKDRKISSETALSVCQDADYVRKSVMF